MSELLNVISNFSFKLLTKGAVAQFDNFHLPNSKSTIIHRKLMIIIICSITNQTPFLNSERQK